MDEIAMSAVGDEVANHGQECDCDLCVRYWFIMSFEGGDEE